MEIPKRVCIGSCIRLTLMIADVSVLKDVFAPSRLPDGAWL
jgi:hypothetical protein